VFTRCFGSGIFFAMNVVQIGFLDEGVDTKSEHPDNSPEVGFL